MNADEIVKALRAYARNAQENNEIYTMQDLDVAANLIESLQSQLSESQRRANAAAKDLHHNDACSICTGSSVEVDGCECECLDCKLNCRCKDCRDESKWQWRGLQEAGKGGAE